MKTLSGFLRIGESALRLPGPLGSSWRRDYPMGGLTFEFRLRVSVSVLASLVRGVISSYVKYKRMSGLQPPW
eukprot:jgi/Botrbrau1/146/Bobra.0022s0131.1